MPLVKHQDCMRVGAAPKPARPTLASVGTGSRALPNRCLVYAREGWGKTSFAAQARECIFLCTKGEDGLEKLIETAQVGPTAHFQEQAQSWADVIAAVDELIAQEHPYRVFVLDTINGAQQLLLAQIVRDGFGGDEKEAQGWGGTHMHRMAVARWKELLDRLDRLREAKRMSILLLGHAEVVKMTNPEGPDYDKFQPALERKFLWAEMARWLDLILFGHVEIYAEKTDPKSKTSRGKASGGNKRLLFTEAKAWYDAKNRHGLQEEIDCGESPADAWAAFVAALKEGAGA